MLLAPGGWTSIVVPFAKLGNRLTDQHRATVMSAIHARIPMTGAEDQRTVQLENAKANASFWDGMVEMHNEMIEGHKQLLEAATKAIAKAKPKRRKPPTTPPGQRIAPQLPD